MCTSPPKDQTCAKCATRPATEWWTGEGGTLAAVHGFYEARCVQCCVEEQLEYARKLAATIPELEAKLIELQGKENTRG
jgi:hypothetical protein